MRSLDFSAKRLVLTTTTWTVLLAFSSAALAANGTWIESTGDGQWGNAANWSGGIIADGTGSTADFSMVDLDPTVVNANFPGFYRNSVGLDSSRTIGNLIFGDTTAATPGGWEVYANTSSETLTLAGGTPNITVHPLGPLDTATLGDATPEFIDDAIIRPNLAGTAGLTKAGAGVLTLIGSANSITGGININAGTLRVRSALTGQTITIANGATLDTNQALRNVAVNGSVHSIVVAAGDTATIRASASIGNLSVGGAHLNIIVPESSTLSADDNWAVTGSAATVNVTGSGTSSVFRMRPNGGSFNTGASFQNSAVTLDNVLAFTRTNSGGNTVNFGSLAGTPTAVLSGGGQGGGTMATYVIGALNTDTEFAGTIDHTSPPDPDGSLNLTKVGAGTLTLSGTLTYQPTANGNPGRRGGITTVSAGTLALANSAAIPGGIAANNLATVDIQSGATLDVSGYTAGVYSTAAMQQVVGAGTIAGNYNHDEGFLRPADTVTLNSGGSGSLTINPIGGAMNVNGNLTLGGGVITYDMTTDPNAGNDLISVSGTTTLSSGTIAPNFLATAPTSGTYTVITSAGGFSGSASNIAVDWPGRGADPVPFISGNNLQFTATATNAGANLKWRGNHPTNPTFWDVQTTSNWLNQSTSSTDTFFQLDSVTFDDTATSYVVDLQETVQPTSVVINNTANAYTIQGAGSIDGTTGLTKTGSGDLTITTNNSFTGPASLSGSGTVNVGSSAGALGAGPLQLNGVTVVSTAGGGFNNSALTTSGTNTIQANAGVGSGNTFSLPDLSGGGTLNLTSTSGDPLEDTDPDGKWWSLDSVEGFTGTLNITGPAGLVGMTVRTNHLNGGDDFSGAVVNLANATLANRQSASGSITFSFGEIHVDANSNLSGFVGGSGTRADTVWEIGHLNTNSNIAGNITDPGGNNTAAEPDRPAISSLVKVGSGTLTLTGAKSYTGDTTVEAGTLSIDAAYLSDTADVYLLTGAMLNLSFAGADTIDSLFFNGVSEAVGTYGAIGSGATFERNYLTGTGLLQVTTQAATPIPGDFDGNGVVDAADLAQWRGDFGGAGSDADADGDSDGADFLVWQRNLGAGTPPIQVSAAAVPEPASAALLTLGSLAVCLLTGRRTM
ncbi:MAG TPA: autotransporter-associated beta strand repeat-containing protein [Lacipirellula sp.]